MQPLSLLYASCVVAQAAVAADRRPVAEALSVQNNVCFDAPTLGLQLEAWLKRSTVERDISLDVRGDPLGADGVTIEIRRAGRSVGTRTFPQFSVSCEEVRSAIAMSAALAIDATEQESGCPEAPQQKPSLAYEPPRHRAPLARALGSLEGVAVGGLLPTWSMGVAPSVGYRVASSISLRASLLATSSSVFVLGGGTVEMRAVAGRLDGCAVAIARRLRLRACLGVLAGRLTTEGSGFADATSTGAQRRALLGGLSRLDLRIPIAPSFGLLAAADFFVRFTRSDVRVEAGDSRPLLPIGVMLGGGPELQFW
jgi:hypothetical protein